MLPYFKNKMFLNAASNGLFIGITVDQLSLKKDGNKLGKRRVQKYHRFFKSISFGIVYSGGPIMTYDETDNLDSIFRHARQCHTIKAGMTAALCAYYSLWANPIVRNPQAIVSVSARV